MLCEVNNNKKMKYLVFDIGGTYVRLVCFKNHRIIEKEKFKTINSNKLGKVISSKTLEVMEKHKIKRFDGIAISAPGYLECEKLKLTAPVNLKGIRNLSFKNLNGFVKKGNIVMENDANCAALGAFAVEKLKNKSVQNLACFTLGTGFGSGLVLNGKLYKGNGIGCEFGHTTIDLNGKKCCCVNVGCLENYVSKRGLIAIAREKGLNESIFKLPELAEKRSKKALAVYSEFAKYLATGLVNIANTLDLDVIYLTGGLVKAGEFFTDKAIKNAKKRFFRGINPKIKVYKGNLSILGGLELVS